MAFSTNDYLTGGVTGETTGWLGTTSTIYTIGSSDSGTAVNIISGGGGAGYVPYVGDNKTKVYRRFPKKKRGDLTGANDPEKRIDGLIRPVVMYEFIKKRFSTSQQRKLAKNLELVCRILESAKDTGQIALKENIEEKFGVVIREQEIFACGFDKFVSSKLLERFVKSVSKKVIKITPIKNYVRVIPKKVLNIKKKADEAKLFDSYVVVHTDPNDTSVQKTQAEKRDPILFGLIKGSEKFYFVADWIDALCDLTFAQLTEALYVTKDEITLNSDLTDTLEEMLE